MRVLAHSVAKGKTVHKVFTNAQKPPPGRNNQKALRTVLMTEFVGRSGGIRTHDPYTPRNFNRTVTYE